jgi:hypothetical protein
MRIASLLFSSSRLSFFKILLIHVLYHLPSAFAQQSAQPSPLSQPLLSPNHTSVLTTGTSYLIIWTPSPYFSNITLEIWDNTTWGYSLDFGSFPCYHWPNPFCGSIISHAPNNGSYLWNIPKPTRNVGHRYPTGKKFFWIKLYVDDFWKDGKNTEPVVTYSEKFAFAMEPGADEGSGGSSTATVRMMMEPTIAPNVLQSSTVSVTKHDPASAALETTAGLYNASTVPTGVPKNITVVVPINGMVSKMGWSLPALLLLFLGWSTLWGWW